MSNLSNVRQQFPLPAEVDDFILRLAEQLNKKPNEVKKEIISSFYGMGADRYYITLGQVQENANKSKKTA